jgi:hypothetical protein
MEGGGTGSWNGVFTAISINGYRTCSDSTCRKDLSAGQWFNCVGTAFSAKTVANEQGCATECLATPGCRYFTYYSGGACNLFVPPSGVCTEGAPSQSQGSWYRFGSSSSVSALESQDTTTLDSTNVGEKENESHQSLITGLSAGLGVAGLLVLVLFGLVIALLVKSGKKSPNDEDKSVQLL